VAKRFHLVLKIGLAGLILVTLIWLFQSGSLDLLTLENIKQNRELLLDRVSQNYFLAVLIYILVYIVVVAFSLPGATIMTLLGGMLFNLWGVIYVNLAATLGATLAFLTSRYLIGDWVQNKFKEKLKKINQEIEKNGWSYLFSSRLVPVFPFWLLNLLSGLTKIKTWKFMTSTALGILPGSFVYVFAGRQISQINNPSDIISTEIILAFSFLILLSLIPVLKKKFIKKN